MRATWGVLLLGLAGCGGGGAEVEGAFAPGTVADRVSVAGSGAVAEADSAGFRVDGLAPGPVRLRLLLEDDTVGVLHLSALRAGSRLRLEGLRVDAATGLAFPRAVRLEGAETVTVNGIRLASEARIPRRADLAGTVLGWAPGAGALLLRPDDPDLPDLRVLVVPATEVVEDGGAPADASALAPGDSLRLEGRRDGAYVVATRLVLAGSDAARDEEEDEEDDAATAARAPSAAPAVRPAPAAPAVEAREPGRGNQGRGKGKEKGKGRGG
jgi:hypothetical protein